VHPEVLTPGDVARLLRVHPKTVTRWAADAHVRVLRTPGGHTRYYREDVEAVLDGSAGPTFDEVDQP